VYGASPPINIGDVSAIAQISGPVGNLRTGVAVTNARSHLLGSRKVVITNEGTVLIRDAVFKVAGGTVKARGQITKQDRLLVVC
jgi:translocation and assembly module TamB